MPEFYDASTEIFMPVALLERETDDYTLRIDADHPGSEARATITPKRSGNIINALELVEMLSDSGIKHGIDMDAVKLLCGSACAGSPGESVVAKATAPVHGDDERIEFTTMPNSDRRRFETMEEDRFLGETIPLIESICKGEQIGRIVPASRGIPGMSIFGTPIPASNGKPIRPYPTAGQNVKWNQSDRTYEADADGRLVFERDTIYITDKYFLNGDVCAKTGSISFIGDIEVTGGVHDGFCVKARNIAIRGNIGDSSSIESEADMSLGSVSGNYNTHIRCQGSLSASSIASAFVEVKGNIEIRGELVNSSIKCAGSLSVASGRIEGGECIALCGINAFSIGTVKGARTFVCAGRCPFIEKDIRRATLEYKRKSNKIARIRRMISPFTYNPNRIKRLKDMELAAFKRLATDYNSLSKETARLKLEVEALQHEMDAIANPIISVRGMIMRGSIVSLGSVTQEISMTVRSPSSIIENPSKRTLRFISLHPISEKVSLISAGLDEEDR